MRSIIRGLMISLMIIVPQVAGVAYGMPKAVVDEYAYNPGDIQQGQPIQHDFIVKNTGDAPLTIKVKPC